MVGGEFDMTITIGQDQVSLLNPPTEGVVCDRSGDSWQIKHTGSGNIILRKSPLEPHPAFLPDGMSLEGFCRWINDQY